MDEDQRQCGQCNSTKPLKKSFETVVEKLHYEPAKITIKRYIKTSYSCRDCESMKVASMPAHILPGITVTPESLATIAVSKYCDSLPLYRQGQIIARSGVKISRDMMARWMILLSKKLTPIYERMQELQLKSPLLLIDETGLQVLREPGRKATSKSYLVARVREGPPGQKMVTFHYTPSRSAESLAPLLEDSRACYYLMG